MLRHLREEILRFVDEHEDLGLIDYQDILKEHGIKGAGDPTVDVSHLDGKVVMALLVYAFYAYREDYWTDYYDEVRREYYRGGYIIRRLNRLKEIDETQSLYDSLSTPMG